jgi:hypothetical protein
MNELGGQIKENRSAEEEMQCSSTLFTMNLIFTGLGLSPSLRGKMPMSNHLTHF